ALPATTVAVAAGRDQAHGLFPTRVPAEWLEPGVLTGALARQAFPDGEEARHEPGFVDDAVGDLDAMVAPGVLQKYPRRVLLISTAACPIHCRYCFRRHFPYGDANAAADGWRGALDYLATRPDVDEVILSGGDPLILGSARLAMLTDGLATQPWRRTLRVHSRTPTVLPSRVNDDLCAWLESLMPTPVIVLHVNHADELTPRARQALGRLRSTGALLLNQSVLLRGVNADPDVLVALGRALVDCGVTPYYLHALDPVAGTHHFAVADDEARRIVDAARARASGYLVPRLVREVPGRSGKTPLG
ncbi:MAG: KamA family radical SAM protein, partial [Pseudomonadota bacterium]